MDYSGSYYSIVLLILYSVKDLEAQTITSRPRNTAALTGSPVTLDCVFTPQVGLVVTWKEYITSSSGGDIYNSRDGKNPFHPRADRYSLNPNTGTGQYNLQITSLQIDDAGYYACYGDPFGNTQYGAYVVSLGRKTCSAKQNSADVDTVIEGQQFTLSCQRGYRSYPGWPPVLRWVGQTATPRNDTKADTVQYEIDLEAREIMDGERFTCATLFTAPPRFTTENKYEDDRTTPTINDDCTTTIKVHWPAKNIVRTPEQQTYYPGNSVTCSASANPKPTNYRWVKLSGKGPQEVTGETLPITEDMLGESMYDCVVTNMVRGVDTNNSRNFTFTVIPTPTTVIPTTWTPVQTTTPIVTGPGVTKSLPLTGSGLSGGAIAGIVIGCLVGVAVIIALIICCLMRSKKEQDTKPMSLQKTQKAGNGVDQVRGGPYMPTDLAYTNNADNRSPTGTGPPPYDPRYPNQPEGGIHYADLSFNSTVDDTPRSRKPIQMSDPGNATVYADIRRV